MPREISGEFNACVERWYVSMTASFLSSLQGNALSQELAKPVSTASTTQGHLLNSQRVGAR